MFQLLDNLQFNNIIFFLIFVFVVYVVYHIIVGVFNRAIQHRNFPRDALNGIKLILKLAGVFVILIGFFTLIKLPSAFLVSFSSVSGIIIGFASIQILNQIVSGIYLISSQPFGVRDMVRLGDTEGIVQEIGINYTLIERFDGTIARLPNKVIIDSQIRNYTIKFTQGLDKNLSREKSSKESQEEIQDEAKEQLSLWAKLGGIKEQIAAQEITRYTFSINVEFDVMPADAFARLNKVCDKYSSVFNYRPQFLYMALGWRPTIIFAIYCHDPYIILHNYSDFVADIAKEINEPIGD
jgi:small-conductance mechanosensitive channel